MAAWVWYSLFAAGSGFVGWPWLAYVFRRSRRSAIREMIDRFWESHRRGREDTFSFPELSLKERLFLEKARLAGVRWTFRTFEQVRWGLCIAGMYLTVMAAVPSVGGWTWGHTLRLLVITGLSGWLFHCLPVWSMMFAAAQRRARMLGEISKFAHRLSICVTDKADIREMIVRAGRPMSLMKPYLNQLAVQWGKDQREAILAFKDAVGISEVYPLVNAFMAISRAKPSDVARLLAEHSRSIDATLESELNKKLENAPVWISFYIMIPFLVCLLLFVYPWVLTILEQLTVSFQEG